MEQLVNFVIRPPRADYNPSEDLLQHHFIIKGCKFQRKDLEVVNEYGHKLQCSHYMPYPLPEGRSFPCVIYCHGNSGCRADAIEAALILLPSNITVFTLDFSGSGLSEGEYVTLGWKEKDDLKAVVNFLRRDEHVTFIGLWGRSMGAVTSLLYGAEDPSIAGMVLDSPFANLVDLMMELVDMYKIRLPKFTVKVAIQYMRKVIQKKALFDIMELDITKVAAMSFIPALFGHATEDVFILPHHSDRLYKNYAGDKNIIKFDGDHNSPRPQFYYDSISIFFHNVLSPETDFTNEPVSLLHDDFELDDLNEQTWHEVMDRQPQFQNVTPDNAVNGRWQRSRIDVPFDLLDSETTAIPISERDCRRYEMPLSRLSASERNEDIDVNSANKSYINVGSSSWHHLDSTENTSTVNDPAYPSLNGFAQYPVNMEDEERMIMEAIAASLENVKLEEGGNHQNEETSSTQGSDLLANSKREAT